MKKIITIAFFTSIVFACSRKTVVTTEAKTNTGTETVNPNTKIKDEAIVVAPATDVHADMLAAGKTLYTTRCTKCHAAKDVTAYTEQRWDGILKSMIPKAHLNDDEAKQVTAYVVANSKK
ncbi:MAG: hypothetical protein M3Y85_07725 [Bacteroidota bacterium]|nr:hypothetical protein [Bacteroidota bacterium]